MSETAERVRAKAEAIRADVAEAALRAARASTNPSRISDVATTALGSGIPGVAQTAALSVLPELFRSQQQQRLSDEDLQLVAAILAATVGTVAAATAIAIGASTSVEEGLAIKLAGSGKLGRRERRAAPESDWKAINSAVEAGRKAGLDAVQVVTNRDAFKAYVADYDPTAYLQLHEDPRVGIGITATIDRALTAYLASLGGVQ